jgi:hypothetical protein
MNDDSDKILNCYLAGIAGEAEIRALEERLRTDALFRKELLIQAAFDTELPVALRELANGQTDQALQPAYPASSRKLLVAPHPQAHRSSVGRRDLRGSTSWLAIAASLAAVAGALIYGTWHDQPPQVIATIADTSPGVTVAVPGRAAEPAMVGMPVHAGDVVTTPADGKASLQYVVNDRLEATTVRLLAGSELRLWKEDSGKRVHLAQGVMLCEVARQEEGRSMIVTTPHAEVEVLGTRFKLAAAEETHLMVDAGSVRLLELASDREIIVSAGGQAVAKGQRHDPYTQVTETFDTADSTAANGWSGIGNTANGHDFGWINSGLGPGGAAGGVFVRASSFSQFADTSIGTVSRTGTLRLAGSLQLANSNYDGMFQIGYFNPGEGRGNFLGLIFVEPIDGGGKPFRCYVVVEGEGGADTGIIELPQNATLSFDLTWTGNPDGSGTLSGTVAGQRVFVPVEAGAGNFSAFGLLSGGARDNDALKTTSNCYFDNLIYTAAAEKNSKR